MARKSTNATKKPRRTTTTVKASPITAEPAPVAKQRKSIFRAGTLIALLLLVAVIELAIYLNGRKETTAAEKVTPVSTKANIFNIAKSSDVSSIEVKPADGEAVKIARNAQQVWAIVSPSEAEADQGLAEAAAAQAGALPILTSIDSSKSPSIFGLDKPKFIITVEFSGAKHVLEVGDSTPSQSGYYVRVDKGAMMVTDLNGIEALLQLKATPPYRNTPTPIATEPPTEAPAASSSTEATPTPAP